MFIRLGSVPLAGPWSDIMCISLIQQHLLILLVCDQRGLSCEDLVSGTARLLFPLEGRTAHSHMSHSCSC